MMYLLNNIEAAEELEKIAAICKTTKLSIACMMGANALRLEMMEKEKPDCANCRHADRMPGIYPCSECHVAYREPPSKWEPKGVDNGQTD